ncbi:MAG: hypothetical protein K2R98_20220 [Gemmataceae bacterium]|nr:hypothetical protein [Gemmataceae bacterium]
MHRIARRQFLKDSAAATLILGLPFLSSGAESDSSPRWADLLEQARERMKREVKLGVLIVIPSRLDEVRKLQNDLSRFIGGHHPTCGLYPTRERPGESPAVGTAEADAQALLCQAVFVCLPAAEARKAFPESKADAAVLLVGLDGKIADSLKAEMDVFGKGFKEKLTELLHGKDGTRLNATIQAQRQALGKDGCARLDAALKDVTSNDFAVRQAATRQLEELAPRCTAELASIYRSKPPLEVTRRLDQIFAVQFNAAPGDKPSTRLPYGTHWVALEASCAGYGVAADCGLSRTPPPARQFLQFLTEKPK